MKTLPAVLLSVLLSVTLLSPCTSALAKDSPAPATVFDIVDAFADGGELEIALEALAETEVDPAQLREILVTGRTYEKKDAGEETIEIMDGYGRKTEVVVVTPRRYDPRTPAGIAFLLHGLGGNGAQLTGLLGDFAEREGMLVVCPTAQALPPGSPNPDTEVIRNLPQAASTHWWSYGSRNMVLSLLRQLGREYNVDRDRILLAGYSMGGFGTWNIGMRFSDRFAAFAPLAGGISGREYLGGDDQVMRSLLSNLAGRPLFFVHGDTDQMVPVRFSQRSDQQLREAGNKSHVYLEVPGGSHQLDMSPRGSIMRRMLDWLKDKKRTPNPKQVSHTLCDTDHGSCHWIRVTELEAETGTVRGRVQGKGKLDIVAEGVSALTVRLNSALARPGKTVTIKLNGKRAFKGKVEASLETLLRTWAEAEDPALLYDSEIELELK